MIKTVFLDLNGTLLPMNDEKFLKIYFGEMIKKIAPFGFPTDKLIYAIGLGTKAMKENDGTSSNEQRFFEVFHPIMGGDSTKLDELLYHFYEHEFDLVYEAVQPSKVSNLMIQMLLKKNIKVVLATNPIFPSIATRKRVKWAGLNWEDFEIVTTYEHMNYAKPNPNYYQTLCDRFDLNPEECMMIGNDATEDMAAMLIGMDSFLVTDCLNNHQNIDINQFKNGTLEDAYHFLSKIPEIKKS